MNGEHKITSSHRERAAICYLRQSSMAQVRQRTESTRSQYALADTAAALGWPRTSIEVIDTGLGISGKWGVAREGFTELVTRMCRGDAGAILALPSLAHNKGRQGHWSRLLPRRPRFPCGWPARQGCSDSRDGAAR